MPTRIYRRSNLESPDGFPHIASQLLQLRGFLGGFGSRHTVFGRHLRDDFNLSSQIVVSAAL
jgi:hypothetical protein